jgi:hypothetical protein
VADAVRDRGVDGVLREVAERAEVVGVGVRGTGERAELGLHLVRGLPGAADDLADAAHGLRVGGHHRDGAQIVETVLGGDGLGADARLGEGDILGDLRVEVVADHEHVEMLVDSVDREGARGVGRGGEDVGFAADADDVGRVATTGAFGMEVWIVRPLKARRVSST